MTVFSFINFMCDESNVISIWGLISQKVLYCGPAYELLNYLDERIYTVELLSSANINSEPAIELNIAK